MKTPSQFPSTPTTRENVVRRLAGVLALAMAITLITGCGTVCSYARRGWSNTYAGSNDKPGSYPGVRFDAATVWTAPVRTVDGEPSTLLFAPLCVADIPISAVADTCLLPLYLKENAE